MTVLLFPISFFNVSLWLASTAIVLLAASEFLSAAHGKVNLPLEKKTIRQAAVLVALLFVFTVLIQIYWVISAP